MKNTERKFYVYVHRRASDGRIFYVGKGSGKRAWDRYGRNRWWNAIVAKHGLEVDFVLKDAPQPCCFLYEKILIAAIGRKNLCNMTDGGEGGIDGNPAWNARTVYCSNGMQFESSVAAAKWLKSQGVKGRAFANGINNVIWGKCYSAFGYTWSDQPNGCEKYIEPGVRMAASQSRLIYCSNGMTFPDSTAAANWAAPRVGKKSCRSTITLACGGRYKTAYGLAWSYEGFDDCNLIDVHAERVRKLSMPVLCVETGEIHSSIQNAARHLQKAHPKQISATKISMACRGIRPRAYDYRWQYV